MELGRGYARNFFGRHAKPLVALGILTAGLGLTELFSQISVRGRIAGLIGVEGDTSQTIPFFCDARNADAVNNHFTGDELRLINGLYQQALNDGLQTRAKAVEAAALASFHTDIRVGVLLNTMQLESSLGVKRVASTSSARGNLQALNNAWMDRVYNYIGEARDKIYWPKYGDKISQVEGKLEDGLFVYTAPKDAEKYLLDLRMNDPQLESYVFAKAWAHDYPNLKRGGDTSVLASQRLMGEAFGNVIRNWFDPEFNAESYLYRVQFLGEKGDAKLHSPWFWNYYWFGKAGDLFPAQAKANKDIFYDHGRARTPAEVHDVLGQKVAGADEVLESISKQDVSLQGTCSDVWKAVYVQPRSRPLALS